MRITSLRVQWKEPLGPIIIKVCTYIRSYIRTFRTHFHARSGVRSEWVVDAEKWS